MLVRPVTLNDHSEILELARQAGIGMTSLPPDADVLEKKIKNAVNSFAGKPAQPGEENFMFVYEDAEKGKLVGTAGIFAHVGTTRPFYSYKISVITQASQALGIYSFQRVLHMVNDYTGASEIGSLFLLPDYRKNGNGRFLSRCRFLMLAEFPQLFANIVISEIRGVQDENGNAPFYENLAKHFFQIEFQQADYTFATQGGQFIADLMPKYPIYVNLLKPEAQDCIGVPLKASLPAMEMLRAEGFAHEGYIDVFDAGPTLQAKREDIRTVAQSRKGEVKEISGKLDATSYIVSNTSLRNFRMVRAILVPDNNGNVTIDEASAEKLQLRKGDQVRYAPF